MLSIRVLNGDITKVPSSAIITAVNASLAWFGGIDKAIYDTSNNMFHNQLAALAPLHDGQLFLAKKQRQHLGYFEDVLFVVDELQTPIYELVLSALKEAEKLKLESVSLPIMRTGMMEGIVESKFEVLEGIGKALLDFSRTNPSNTTLINLVAYHDPASVKTLEALLAPHKF